MMMTSATEAEIAAINTDLAIKLAARDARAPVPPSEDAAAPEPQAPSVSPTIAGHEPGGDAFTYTGNDGVEYRDSYVALIVAGMTRWSPRSPRWRTVSPSRSPAKTRRSG